MNIVIETWTKKNVERIPESYAEKFPEDLGDCLLCGAERSGIWMGAQSILPDDPRILKWMKGINVLFTFSLCSGCYELPDIETQVVSKVVSKIASLESVS
jgi:hypothetical protein